MPASRRATATLSAVLALSAAAAVPASVTAEPSGGVSAPADGAISFQAGPAAFVGRSVRATGTVAHGEAGRTVRVQALGSDGSWTTLASTETAPDDSFVARWRADKPGRMTVRAIVSETSRATASQEPEPLTDQVVVYRPATATWYGPGFYGRRTACGRTLTPGLVGVAHRTLPCGSKVAVYYRGRSVVVPVVDRGPFANGASWDLTAAAAKSLGFTQTARIGALPL